MLGQKISLDKFKKTDHIKRSYEVSFSITNLCNQKSTTGKNYKTTNVEATLQLQNHQQSTKSERKFKKFLETDENENTTNQNLWDTVKPGLRRKFIVIPAYLTFSQKGHTDGQQAYEKMSNITIIREMRIKTTIRYHYTPVRTANIKKNANNKCWKNVVKMECQYTAGENVNGRTHCRKQCGGEKKTVWRFPKTKNRSTNSTLGYSSERKKKTKKKNPTNSKRYMHSKVHSSNIYNCQKMQGT